MSVRGVSLPLLLHRRLVELRHQVLQVRVPLLIERVLAITLLIPSRLLTRHDVAAPSCRASRASRRLRRPPPRPPPRRPRRRSPPHSPRPRAPAANSRPPTAFWRCDPPCTRPARAPPTALARHESRRARGAGSFAAGRRRGGRRARPPPSTRTARTLRSTYESSAPPQRSMPTWARRVRTEPYAESITRTPISTAASPPSTQPWRATRASREAFTAAPCAQRSLSRLRSHAPPSRRDSSRRRPPAIVAEAAAARPAGATMVPRRTVPSSPEMRTGPLSVSTDEPGSFWSRASTRYSPQPHQLPRCCSPQCNRERRRVVGHDEGEIFRMASRSGDAATRCNAVGRHARAAHVQPSPAPRHASSTFGSGFRNGGAASRARVDRPNSPWQVCRHCRRRSCSRCSARFFLLFAHGRRRGGLSSHEIATLSTSPHRAFNSPGRSSAVNVSPAAESGLVYLLTAARPPHRRHRAWRSMVASKSKSLRSRVAMGPRHCCSAHARSLGNRAGGHVRAAAPAHRLHLVVACPLHQLQRVRPAVTGGSRPAHLHERARARWTSQSSASPRSSLGVRTGSELDELLLEPATQHGEEGGAGLVGLEERRVAGSAREPPLGLEHVHLLRRALCA